jgi:para-aminobenzoate synthetase
VRGAGQPSRIKSGVTEYVEQGQGHSERAPEPVHGRVERIMHQGHSLFQDLPLTFDVVRYHSLIAHQLPSQLQAIAWNLEGLLMGVAHRELPLWGLQFHPEPVWRATG